MSEISVKELRESPRTPGRYLVVLSNQQQCIVGIDALADTGATRVGAVLDIGRLERLLYAGAVTALVDRALNYLARGRRTRRELELRLRNLKPGKPIPDVTMIAMALDRLEANGVLSDDDVAKAEASARLRRGEAPARVRQMLRRKGVGARSVDAAILEAVELDGFDELSACRAQAEKRWRSLSALEPTVARRRLMGFLQRRGFSGEVVRAIVRDLERR